MNKVKNIIIIVVIIAVVLVAIIFISRNKANQNVIETKNNLQNQESLENDNNLQSQESIESENTIQSNENLEVENYNENELNETDVEVKNIKINKIENMAFAKIMAESKDIKKEELPKEIANLTNLNSNEASIISAVYTKTDYSKDEFDLLHNYVIYFFNEDNDTSIKISASKEEKPLRDYFFQEISNDMSNINGVAVKISQYEERYIINLEKGAYQLDIETTGLTENEMIDILEEVIK